MLRSVKPRVFIKVVVAALEAGGSGWRRRGKRRLQWVLLDGAGKGRRGDRGKTEVRLAAAAELR